MTFLTEAANTTYIYIHAYEKITNFQLGFQMERLDVRFSVARTVSAVWRLLELAVRTVFVLDETPAQRQFILLNKKIHLSFHLSCKKSIIR